MSTSALLILIPLAYVVGSIPFGLIVGLARGVDPRSAGSGNIGATNVGRLLGKKFFFLVFFLDLLKSLLPMAVASALVHRLPIEQRDARVYLLWLLVGFAAVLGHVFSLFLKFKGGKGVATSAGVMLGLYPYFTLPGLVAIAVFIVVFYAWRYISLGSLAAAATLPVAYLGIGLARDWPVFGSQLPLLLFALVMAGLIVAKHRANIARLRAGTENRFGSKPPAAPAATAPAAANSPGTR
ncbi:MAG TPA: glycerol-3-phosphate 1-O-acyltransferase PlsY [Tepidisphaeraceae bacterium]|nr:glycerol-3-phosphate 1-O-acyltransferase PlsY [Tepidisphaeraceae bacterium]